MWLPDHIDRITLKYRIGSDQRKFFLDALRNQDAIEGIAMMHRQSCPLHDMPSVALARALEAGRAIRTARF
jgi:hypothetical protein